MNFKSLIILFTIVLLSLSASSQKEFEGSINVRRATLKQTINGHQLFYSLPKNVVRIEITVQKTIQLAGPYAKFASKYLNISDGYISHDSEYYEIKDVNFNRYSLPDSNEVFFISASNTNILPSIQLNSDGVIVGCNLKDEVQGYTTATCQMISPQLGEEDYHFFDYGVKPFLVNKEEKAFKMVQTDSTPSRVSYNKTTKVGLTDDQIAEELAALIRKIRKRKMKLLFNIHDEVNPMDGKAMEVSLKELQNLETYYLSLFVGKTNISEEKIFFDYDPAADIEAEQQIIGWFSTSYGLRQGKPEIRRSDFKPIIVKSSTVGRLLKPKIQEVDNSLKTPIVINHGLYYRVPGRIDMTIEYLDQVLTKKQMQIAQKGIVLPMPIKYLERDYQIEFYPETGGVKRIINPFLNSNNKE